MDDYLWEILQAQGEEELPQKGETVRRKMEEQRTAGVEGDEPWGEYGVEGQERPEESRRRGLEHMEAALEQVVGTGQAGILRTGGGIPGQPGMVDSVSSWTAVQEEGVGTGTGYQTVGKTVETVGGIHGEGSWGQFSEAGQRWENTEFAPERLSMFFQRDSRRYS